VSRDKLGIWAAVYVFTVCAYFLPGASWSPASRYALTRAIVERQSFEITHYAESTGDRARVGDRFFTEKAPLPSLLAVPAYALFYAVSKVRGHFPAFRAEGTEQRPAQRVSVSPAYRNGLYACSLSTSGFAAATLVWALFRLLRRRVGETAALMGAVSTALATPLFPYATSFFGHTIAAAFLLGAYACTARSVEGGAERPTLAGLLLVGAVGSEYLAAIPAAIIAGFFLAGSEPGARARRARGLVVGAAAPALVLAAYHSVCFGAPWRTGYSFVEHPAFAGQSSGFFGITWPRLEAIYGLSFGTSRGLFYLAPVSAAAIWAGVRAWRVERDRALPIAALALFGLFLVNAS
jgi:hypothetical protein